MIRACLFLALGLPAVIGAAPAAAADAGPAAARVADLKAKIENTELLVSFRIEDAFPTSYEERLHSGIPLSYRHRVDMLVKRPFFMVPNKLLGRTVVETKIEYDALTRQYRLYRRTENKVAIKKDDQLLDLEVRRSTDSLKEAVDWLTVLEDVPLPWRPDAAPRDRIRVRVSSNLGRRFILYMFPSNYAVTAELRLEF